MKSIQLFSAVFVGLWLCACTHAVTRDASEPEKKEVERQEAPQSTSPSQASSSGAVKPEPQQTGEKTSVSRTTPSDHVKAEQQKAREKLPTGQQASADATKSKPEKARENASGSRKISPDTAAAKLEEARENLRISQATEKRIASELEQLKKSGKASPEAIKDYEVYHERVQEMVAENRKIVERMEAAYTRYSPGNTKPAPSSELDKLVDPTIPEEKTADQVAALDRELNQSLAEFDDMLLKEMDAIRDNAAQKMHDLAKEAAEAARRLREKGVELDTYGSPASEGAEESSANAEKQTDAKKGETETGREMDAADREAGTASASRERSRKGGEGPSRKDQRRVDYEDDDIVARQLREAAENETDPELKEKLWKEYEEYKKNK